MKAEAWIFAACTIFLVLVTPAYWLITDAERPRPLTGPAPRRW